MPLPEALLFLVVALAGSSTIGTQIVTAAYAGQFYPMAIRATGVEEALVGQAASAEVVRAAAERAQPRRIDEQDRALRVDDQHAVVDLVKHAQQMCTPHDGLTSHGHGLVDVGRSACSAGLPHDRSPWMG